MIDDTIINEGTFSGYRIFGMLRNGAIFVLMLCIAACDTGSPDLTPPVVDFSVTPNDPRAGMEVTFTAQVTPSEAEIIRHSWDFDGDAQEDAAGSVVTHTFESAGEYPVALTVTDSHGAVGEAVHSIVVAPPYAKVTITTVTIEDLPLERSPGEPWDDDDGPDIYFRAVDESGTELARSEVVQDVDASSLPLTPTGGSFTITRLDKRHRIEIYDADDEGEDEFIRGIDYVYGSLIGAYPEAIRLDVGTGLVLLVQLSWSD